MRAVGLAILAIAFASPEARASATPKISGAYAVSYNEICQAGNPSNPTRGVGETYSQILVAAFDAKTKTVTFKGTSVNGPLTGPNVAPSRAAVDVASTAYSNTATTITIGKTTYDIVYGPVNADGVATSAAFGGVSDGGCAASATALLQ